MIAIGFFFSMQLRSKNLALKEEEQKTNQQLESYKKQLEEIEKELSLLQSEFDENTKEYQKLLEALSESDSSFYETLKTYHNNIDEMKLRAGLTEVTGEGIVITLQDSVVSGDEYSAGAIVHDTTILSLVNQLKLAGAKAISVNDERIVAMSEFICVGPAVKVNDTKLFAPYTIKATGNPELLETAIKTGSVMTNPNINIIITVEKQDKVTIPAYNKAYRNNIDQLKDIAG